MKDRIDHHNFDEWLAADLLDDLTPEEREAFDHYLQENLDARSLHHQTTAMSHLLDASLAGDRPGPNFETRLLQAFRKEAAHHPLKNLFSLLSEKLGSALRLPAVYIPATAALLVALVALVALGSVLTRPMESDRSGKLAVAAPLGILGNGEFSKRLMNAVAMNEEEKDSDGFSAKDAANAGIDRRSSFQASLSPSSTIDAIASSNLSNGKKEARNRRLADTPTALPESSGSSHGMGAAGSFKGAISEAPQAQPMAASDQLTLTAGNTYTGGTTVSSGTLLVSSGPVSQTQQPPASPSGLQQPNSSRQSPSEQGIVDGRKLVRDASLDLEVKNYDAALDGITSIAAGNSGYVATKNSARLPNGKMSGTVVVKVLPSRLDDALLQIRALGELKNQSLSTRDVTKEYFDTDARLRNARKMEERLLALLDTVKGKVSELLAVEKELARVREQIEEMQGELKVYDSLVQYATITISLREKDMNEAAAYLLQENVTLSLFSSDVEKTYGAARREADDAKAQIVRSRIDRDDSGRATAVLSFLVAPEEADGLIVRLKALGRVQNFNRESRRVAQDGSGNSATAKVERDKVQINLSILQDDESRKQVVLTVITKQVEAAFENAKAAAAAQGGNLLGSNLQHPAEGGTTATLTVRVPAVNYTALMETFKKAGLVSQFNIQRDDMGTEDGAKSPVLILLTLTDTDQPVQFTQAAVLTPDVETQATHIKQSVEKPGSQVEVKSSSFERTPDGRQTALLVFRLPLEKYQPFLDKIGSLGKLKELSIRRQDRTDASSPSLATAEVTLRLYNQGNVVAEENGIWTTLRKTLGDGTASLMWSVRMIGVALAFIAPWILLPGIIIWIVRKFIHKSGKQNP